MNFYIQDWAGNVCFKGREFENFEDAEEFLEQKLEGDDYETDRGEYYIVQGTLRESNYLAPNDPRASKKVSAI